VYIEIHGSEQRMDDIRLAFQDQLEKAGFEEVSKFGSMDTGVLISYIKQDFIVSIQVTGESELNDSKLRVETEQEMDEIRLLWDSALIVYAIEVLKQIKSFAQDVNRVDQGIK